MVDARESLIAAARELMWERGYAATSPRAVLHRSGVGQGSMYHHFDGKEALAAAAFERSAAQTLARAEDALAQPGTDPVARIVAYLNAQRDVLRGCPVGRMAGDADVLASPTLHGILESTFARMRALVTDAAAEAIAAGRLPTDLAPAELADTVLAVVQGGYVLARAADDRRPFTRAVAGAVAMIESLATGTKAGRPRKAR